MEKVHIAQEVIYIIAFFNALWACCFWEESIILKKSAISRLKWVMISLDCLITAGAVVVYVIDPYFLFADWVIIISLILAVVTQWLTISFLKERLYNVPEDRRLGARLANRLVKWLVKLDKELAGGVYREDAPERPEK